MIKREKFHCRAPLLLPVCSLFFGRPAIELPLGGREPPPYGLWWKEGSIPLRSQWAQSDQRKDKGI